MENDPFPSLETARLRLRCVVAEDAAAMAVIMTPGVSRWVATWPVPFTPEMADARIQLARESARRGDALPCAVIDKADGAFIGWAAINRDKENPRRGSFGYWLGERSHGKGYMREVAPIALAVGFDMLDLDVIEAAALPENIASIAVMVGCGMERTGEGMIYVPTRERHELCRFYEIKRPRSLA
jgi:[ribosomal protein S5]-alanine N-acetyltransferase